MRRAGSIPTAQGGRWHLRQLHTRRATAAVLRGMSCPCPALPCPAILPVLATNPTSRVLAQLRVDFLPANESSQLRVHLFALFCRVGVLGSWREVPGFVLCKALSRVSGPGTLGRAVLAE